MDEEKLKKIIEDILLSDRDDLYKKIAIISVITEALKDIDVTPVIVGGQAVEFYTSGGYSTMDIDILCEARISEINSILEPLGFVREGKYWTLKNSDIAIEVPSGPLAGSWDKLTEVEIEELTAYIIGIEDIIVDRLNRYKYWQVYEDEEWIVGMIIVNYRDIDWDYITIRAKEEGTVNELKDFKEKAEKVLNQ